MTPFFLTFIQFYEYSKHRLSFWCCKFSVIKFFYFTQTCIVIILNNRKNPTEQECYLKYIFFILKKSLVIFPIVINYLTLSGRLHVTLHCIKKPHVEFAIFRCDEAYYNEASNNIVSHCIIYVMS